MARITADGQAVYSGDIRHLMTETAKNEYAKFLYSPYRKQGDTKSFDLRNGSKVEVTLLD